MSDATIRDEVVVVNPQGLHLKPFSQIMRVAQARDAEITLTRGGESADCTSIMEMMLLAAPQGSRLTIEATGPEAAEAVQEIRELFARGFGE